MNCFIAALDKNTIFFCFLFNMKFKENEIFTHVAA